MEEKKYLNIPTKIAYGADGIGHCFFHTFISTYIMVYLTNAVGMNAGIIGTLMLVSKIFDGLSDILFGSILDRTNTRWGKARPWLLGSAVPLAIVQVMVFSVPQTSSVAQYAYFFVIYAAANSIFYTANNCAYNTLSNLITHNKTERVQLGSVSFIGESIAGILIPVAVTRIVGAFDNPLDGWRTAAFVFALAQLIFSAVTFFGTKEIPFEDEADKEESKQEKVPFSKILKIIITNKYYWVMLGISLMIACIGTTFFTSGAYYCEWILKDGALLSVLSMAFSFGMLVGMIINPIIVSKIGYRLTMGWGNVFSVIFLIIFAIGAYTKSLPLLFIGMFFKNMTGFAAIGCCMYAAIGDIAKYSYRIHGVHVEGSMFSCSSMGRKVGQGITASVCGWLLTVSGYVGNAVVQSTEAINMINFMFAVLPIIFTVILVILSFNLKVEKANENWEMKETENLDLAE